MNVYQFNDGFDETWRIIKKAKLTTTKEKVFKSTCSIKTWMNLAPYPYVWLQIVRGKVYAKSLEITKFVYE